MPLYTQPPVRIIASSAVAASGAADTNENTLATVTVPAGIMGLNGIVRVTTSWTFTNNANNKTPRIKFGGTTVATYTGASNASLDVTALVQNRASASSQMATGLAVASAGNSKTNPQALAIDTSAAVTILITAQKATGTDTMTLENYIVELLIP